MVARLHHKIAGVLVIVPLLLFVLTTNQEDVVSAFIATTTNRRTPAPALIVVRDPSTVPAIDWDIFEMEEQRAFDSATIIAPRPKYIPDFDVASTHPEAYPPLQVTTPGTIEVPPDDPDAWKGSLIMAAGLMATQHDIPAMMLLLSTAATGEFGTAVRLTSRCAWRSFDVCKVLSMEGFQSVTDLLKDVGVMEQEKGRENWVMSWAKRSWNDAVKQERQWAKSMRSFFVPDETETLTLSDLKKSVMTAPVIQPEVTKPEPVQTFAGTLLREEGVLVLPIIQPTDPTTLSGKQRVRDLMRQQRELKQDRTVVSDLQVNIVAEESNIIPPVLQVKESIVAEESNANPPAVPVVNTAAATRQRVRDLMRQQREGGSASSIRRDRKETPSLFTTGGMTTTATLRQSSTMNSAADSRQRVRDLMRQRGKQDNMTPTIASTSTADKISNTSNTPSLFTSAGITTTAANFQSVTERAAGSRQRVRDLMRQKQEQVGSIDERPFTTTAPQMCLAAAAASAVPAESSVSITAMEERFRKQRVLNAVVRNKIRGMMIQKSMVDDGTRKETTNAKEEEGKTPQEEILRPVSASGWSPLTMTEKKTLSQARMALVATSKMPEHVSMTSIVEPKLNHQRKSWRYRIAEWLNGASPQGWATAW